MYASICLIDKKKEKKNQSFAKKDLRLNINNRFLQIPVGSTEFCSLLMFNIMKKSCVAFV